MNIKAKFIGIDIEEPMINKAKERCQGVSSISLKSSNIWILNLRNLI